MGIVNDIKRLKLCLLFDQGHGEKGSSLFFIRSIINPCYSVLYTFRLGSFLVRYKKMLYPLYLLVCIYHRWNSYKTGILIYFGTQIGKGLTLAHYGNIVINSDAVIGENCLIFQGVTIGSKRGPGGGKSPIIGNNVIMFSGCKILGDIRVGDNVVIGANAVVIKDIPDNAVVVGVPSKIISMNAKETIRHYLNV